MPHAIALLSLIAIMAQLVVRKVEDIIVRRLKQQAGAHGVSMEEEHRRILRASLLGKASAPRSFKAFLQQMPDVASDKEFLRSRDLGRKVDL